jgi:hypothetical protein
VYLGVGSRHSPSPNANASLGLPLPRSRCPSSWVLLSRCFQPFPDLGSLGAGITQSPAPRGSAVATSSVKAGRGGEENPFQTSPRQCPARAGLGRREPAQSPPPPVSFWVRNACHAWGREGLMDRPSREPQGPRLEGRRGGKQKSGKRFPARLWLLFIYSCIFY